MSEQQRSGSAGLKAAATGTEVVENKKSIFTYLDHPKVKQGLAAVAPKYLQPERIMRLYINVATRTPDLQKCDPQTVLGAFMTTTALGLEPNTVQQLAWLLPYKRSVKRGGQWVETFECQFQIGARGFVTLYYRVPTILQVSAGAVHAGDHFRHMKGSNTFLEFAEKVDGPRGDMMCSFSHVKMRDGGESACVLPLDEIYKIRERSETWRALVKRVEQAQSQQDKDKAERKLMETPWEMWFGEMATKSATKRHAKILPIAASDTAEGRRLDAASEIDGRGEVRKLDLRAMTDPDVVRSVINDGYDPPEPEYLDDDGDDETSGEAYGATARAAEAPAQAGAQQKAADWQPSEEEKAAIRAREMAEASGAPPAPAAPATPAPPPPRRGRQVGSVE